LPSRACGGRPSSVRRTRLHPPGLCPSCPRTLVLAALTAWRAAEAGVRDGWVGYSVTSMVWPSLTASTARSPLSQYAPASSSSTQAVYSPDGTLGPTPVQDSSQ